MKEGSRVGYYPLEDGIFPTTVRKHYETLYKGNRKKKVTFGVAVVLSYD